MPAVVGGGIDIDFDEADIRVGGMRLHPVDIDEGIGICVASHILLLIETRNDSS